MEREYQSTHPWITFELNLQGASPLLWMLLGEAKSKCEHIAGTPLRPTVANELHKLFLAKGASATTAIEGNPLSEEQVRANIDGKLHLPPSQQYLKQEVDNVLMGYKHISRRVARGTLNKLAPEVFTFYNKLVLRDLPLGEGVVPGEITHQVTVGDYRGAPREDCMYLMGRLSDWLEGPSFNHPSIHPTILAILKAIVLHLYIAWIHPFGDGNGRTARLLEFRALMEAGIPSPAAHLLSSHYNQTRSEYYRLLSYSSKSGGDILPFIQYAVQGFVDGLKGQLSLIREQQLDVAWRSVIFGAFKDKHSKADIRMRTLVWEISKQNSEVEISKIRDVSLLVFKEYKDLSDRTIWRDLEELASQKLIAYSKDRKRVKASKELVHAFLPARRIEIANWQAVEVLNTNLSTRLE